MMNFDDEVLATVRALSATVGVPEHLPAAAAGRARRADILDRGFVPRVLTAFDVARYAALGGSDDDDEEDPDDDGSVANLTAVLSAAAVGGSDDDLDDGSLSSAADEAAA